MLTRLIARLADWDITILATDINPASLRKARAGCYREWSFRSAPPWLKTDFFTTSASGECELVPRVRQMVTFSYLNLVDDTYPSLVSNTSAMDVILCRNVMMYFAADRARLVASRLQRSLLDGGWLVTSPSEGCYGCPDLFAGVTLGRGDALPQAASRPGPRHRRGGASAGNRPDTPPAPGSPNGGAACRCGCRVPQRPPSPRWRRRWRPTRRRSTSGFWPSPTRSPARRWRLPFWPPAPALIWGGSTRPWPGAGPPWNETNSRPRSTTCKRRSSWPRGTNQPRG